LLLLVFALGAPGVARALPITLTLDPSAVVLTAGQTLTVDVVVDGLFDGSEIALESFDLNLSFDTARLQFDALTFGISLGDPNDSGETFLDVGLGDPNVNGVVEMGEFSLLLEADLLDLQSAPFTLATIEFTALANPGDVTLALIDLNESSLGGVAGAELGIGSGLAAPSSLLVTILPEPGAAALLLPALALLGRRQRSAAH
jgi:hypothetical protein